MLTIALMKKGYNYFMQYNCSGDVQEIFPIQAIGLRNKQMDLRYFQSVEFEGSMKSKYDYVNNLFRFLNTEPNRVTVMNRIVELSESIEDDEGIYNYSYYFMHNMQVIIGICKDKNDLFLHCMRKPEEEQICF